MLQNTRKWIPDRFGNFQKPSELLLSDLLEDLDNTSPQAKALAVKLGFKKDIEMEFLSQISESERRKIEFARTLSEDEIEFIEEKRKLEKKYIEAINEELDYGEELEKAFTRILINESEDIHIPPGPIPNPSYRREKVEEDIREHINKESLILERFKRIPANKWEQKNNEIRIFLKEQYGGQCQICGYTFVKRDGDPYFEGVYLVSRTKATWIDRPRNVLCLCANCCAKFKYGQVEADNFLEQIKKFRTFNEGGNGEAIIKLKLCDEDVEIKFSERHMLDLQEILKSGMKE